MEPSLPSLALHEACDWIAGSCRHQLGRHKRRSSSSSDRPSPPPYCAPPKAVYAPYRLAKQVEPRTRRCPASLTICIRRYTECPQVGWPQRTRSACSTKTMANSLASERPSLVICNSGVGISFPVQSAHSRRSCMGSSCVLDEVHFLSSESARRRSLNSP